MKRLSPSLCALALATGAGLLFAGSSSAQSYNPYTNTYEATNNPDATRAYNGTVAGAYTVTTAGTYVGNESGTQMLDGGYKVHGIASTGFASNANGNAEYSYLVSTTPNAGSPINGMGTWTNGGGSATPGTPSTANYQGNVVAHSGTQSILQSFQQDSTTGGFQRFVTAGTAANPTVDLAGTVSFWMYVDTGAGTGTTAAPNTTSLNSTSAVKVNIDVDQVNTVISVSDVDALGKYNSTQDGASPPQYSEYAYDTAITGGLPQGGIQVNAGQWQQVTFNLATDPMAYVAGSNAAPTRSGLGSLFAFDVTPVNPTTGLQANASQVNQVYNIYFDDLTITAAPEPSAWLGLAAGGAMLLGLGLVSARRRRGANAA